MAALACNRSAYIEAGKCFTQPNFTALQQQAIIVYRLAQILANAGGTDYTGNISGLWTAAQSATCGMTEDQLIAGFIGVLNAEPTQSTFISINSAIESLDKADAAAAIVCLKNYSMGQLKIMQMFLFCSFYASAS